MEDLTLSKKNVPKSTVQKQVFSEPSHEFKIEFAASSLELELDWLKTVISARMDNLKSGKKGVSVLTSPPDLVKSPLKELIDRYDLDISERITLALAIAADLRPEYLDLFLDVNKDTGRTFREVGGIIDRISFSFQPTLKTALFLLSGNEVETYLHYQNTLTEGNRLFVEQIVNLFRSNELPGSISESVLKLDSAYSLYLFSGKSPRLDSGHEFPAKLLETSKSFSDLVLKESALKQLTPAMNYAKVKNELYKDESVNKALKKGFVLLLHGPPGTGKTMTASVIGKELNTPVYQVDSSMVVSKYIGETEKNLERIFLRLEGKNCILFFDEADALFGKRTEVRDSKDRFANQGVAYLLQRIEKFDGLVILASNYEQNFDDAFKRRILSKVHIGRPGVEERIKLWKQSIPKRYSFESDDLIGMLSKHFDFTGANIAIVIKMSVEQAFVNKTKVLSQGLISPFLEIVGREVAGANFRPLPLKRTTNG